ncbi:MAG: hypothetical protein ABH854_01240 [Candidatus Diapherotrites archaeon]|nr:hypothetical protein [Candidatus Micrarchaeota archaeon]MBU1939526.1 hypothetical protein [Candidatus Micrarchaeota archaeon]
MKSKDDKSNAMDDYGSVNVRLNNDAQAGLGRHYGGSFFEYKCSKCGNFDTKENMFDLEGKLICEKCARLLKGADKERLIYLPKKVGYELGKIH